MAGLAGRCSRDAKLTNARDVCAIAEKIMKDDRVESRREEGIVVQLGYLPKGRGGLVSQALAVSAS